MTEIEMIFMREKGLRMTEETSMKKMGRLALREEDNFWVAYYAMPDTMDGALFLGCIHMRFVEDEKRKLIFMSLMQAAAGDLIEEAVGERPVWNKPQVAPVRERRGNA